MTAPKPPAAPGETLITPPGFEHYFAEVALVLDDSGRPDLDALAATCARYELEMDFGSMERLIAEHGLEAPPR